MSQETTNFELTGNESIEELDSILDQLESELSDETVEATSKSKEEPSSTADETLNAERENAESATAGEQSEEQPVIIAKDGVNTIPFEVLERERDEKRILSDRIHELEGQVQASSRTERLIEVRNKQLEKLGVELEELPEDFKVTDEKMEELSEDYPELASVIKYLVTKVDSQEKAPQPANPSEPTHSVVDQKGADPVTEAIASIPELSAMVNEGGDDWARAQEIDEQLRVDPVWRNKPLKERFAEVTKMVTEESTTRAQQVAEQAAQKALDQASSSLPSSPSEIGGSSTHMPSAKEFLSDDVSAEQLMEKFDSMSPEQIDAYLAAGGI